MAVVKPAVAGELVEETDTAKVDALPYDSLIVDQDNDVIRKLGAGNDWSMGRSFPVRVLRVGNA